MADLDDFFAKKDRKKSKSVKKFSTTDEVAKKLDDPKQKSDVRPKKERPTQEGEEGNRAGLYVGLDLSNYATDFSAIDRGYQEEYQEVVSYKVQLTAKEEEEWKEYEEPVKDYTGLKIQVLQGGNGQPESGRDSASEDATSADGAKIKGPWNKPEAPEPAAPPPEEKREAAPKASTAYVPPVVRRAAEPVVRRHQSKHAPDINNDDFFPMLGAGARRGGGGGSACAGAAAAAGGGGGGGGPPLTLGNRYNTLREDS